MNFDLKRFIVFNSSEGQEEGCERDKLLFHWTKDVIDNKIDLTEQIDDVCLCDASISTSIKLSSGLLDAAARLSQTKANYDEDKKSRKGDQPYQCDLGRSYVIVLDPTIIIIVEVELNQSIWMAVHVVPQAQPAEHTIDHIVQHSPGRNLDPNAIPCDAIKQVVRNIYQRFCLINGTFQMIAGDVKARDESNRSDTDLRTEIRKQIRTTCERYFTAALAEIHLSSIITNVASLYNYIVYIDLNPLTLMKVNSFINHLVCVDPNQIRHTVAIFNDQLLWSSLNANDSRLLYNYLVAVLIRDALQEELIKETDKVRRIAEEKPIYLHDDNEDDTINQVIVEMSNIDFNTDRLPPTRRLTKYYLTVFRSSNNLTLALIFKDTNQMDLIQKCEQLLVTDTRLGVVPMASLAKSVGQNFIKSNALVASNLSLSTANTPASSTPSKRRQSNISSSSTRGAVPSDQRYLCLDRLSASVSSSFNDAPTRDSHSTSFDIINSDTSGCRKLRLVKHMLDWEPEMRDIYNQTSSRVEEYLAKTTGDIWFTVLNTKYRCIYSIYKMRNAGLTEARQSAINLRSTIVCSRP